MVQLEQPRRRVIQAQLFSYRSLLTFKLMKEVPFAGGARPNGACCGP